MTFEQAKQELRSEPVGVGMMERTIQSVANNRPSLRPIVFRRGFPFAVGLCVVIGFAVYPWRKSDQLWAQAKSNLFDSKFIHIIVKGNPMHGDSEVWIHGLDIMERRTIRYGQKMLVQEWRSCHSQFGTTIGQVTSVEKWKEWQIAMMDGFRAFDDARRTIGIGEKINTGRSNTTITRKIEQGKVLMIYKFKSGSVGFGMKPQDPGFGVADIYLTAFVDVDSGNIVRIEQTTEANPRLAKYKENHAFTLGDQWIHESDMVATIDYPTNIDEKVFDIPKDAYDSMDSKNVVARLLATKVESETVKGQTIGLHGIFMNGYTINVVWSGYPAEYNSPDRFRIDGVSLGDNQDARCLSSAKFIKNSSSKVPFCQQGAEVLSDVPKTVTLTMPVFAPDQSRPFEGKRGFHSKKIGEVTFKNVLVTNCHPFSYYERQFGLLNKWW